MAWHSTRAKVVDLAVMRRRLRADDALSLVGVRDHPRSTGYANSTPSGSCFIELFVRSLGGGENLEVVDVANFLAGVDINPDVVMPDVGAPHLMQVNSGSISKRAATIGRRGGWPREGRTDYIYIVNHRG
jgi:hypothetical protein